MALIKTSEMPQANPLNGTELVDLVQGGINKKAPASYLTALNPPMVRHPGLTYPSGYFAATPAATTPGALSPLAAAGVLELYPLYVGPGPFDRIGCSTTVAGTAMWKLGYYPMTASGDIDWANPFTAGNVDMSGTTGHRTITINNTPTSSWVWVALLVDAYTSNPTVNFANVGGASGIGISIHTAPTTTNYGVLRWTGVATGGSLPTANPGVYTSITAFPCIYFRYT